MGRNDAVSFVSASSMAAIPGGIVPIGINYFGGPVMWKPITIHLIYYGDFSDSQKTVFRTLVESMAPNEDPAVTGEW